MEEEINIGVIGVGRIGKLHVENLIRSVPGIKLKAVADINVERSREWAEKLCIDVITNDYRVILDDPGISVVVICSSTDTHAQFIIESAKAGKDIFCEKPIDYEIDRIRQALEAVRDAGVKLMVGFNRRFDHNFKRVRQLVAGGEIGIPHIIK
ncbi:MAG: Gfo/Idh/MocA family oxidoreductase, partial [Promethearchaeota archaeon]